MANIIAVVRWPASVRPEGLHPRAYLLRPHPRPERRRTHVPRGCGSARSRWRADDRDCAAIVGSQSGRCDEIDGETGRLGRPIRAVVNDQDMNHLPDPALAMRMAFLPATESASLVGIVKQASDSLTGEPFPLAVCSNMRRLRGLHLKNCYRSVTKIGHAVQLFNCEGVMGRLKTADTCSGSAWHDSRCSAHKEDG